MINDKLDLGKFLKATREDLDLTQIDVMKKTGINNKTLSGYENNVAEPDLETFSVLAKLYGFSIDALFETNSAEFATEEEKLLIEYYRTLPEKSRKALIISVKNKIRIL